MRTQAFPAAASFIRKFRAALFIACIGGIPSASAQTSSQIADVRIRGDLRSIQPMPDGSFILGGNTTYYNGVRDTQLLRIMPNGTRVNFPVQTNSGVLAMAHSAPWLYIGGAFTTVNGVSAPFIARVNDTTGAVDAAWRPAPNGDVVDVKAVSGRGILIAGAFSNVGGLTRRQLALVSDTGTGRPDTLWRCDANGQVDSIIVSGGWLYAGGRFTQIGGNSVPYLARTSLTTGAVDTTWAPRPNFHVYDIALDGTHLYFGGSFTRVNTTNLRFLARCVLSTGAFDSSWQPRPDRLVTNLAMSSNAVYAAGDFRVWANTTTVKKVARVLKTGLVDGMWSPVVEGTVLALESDGVDGAWGAGRFDSGTVTGSAFARFPLALGSGAPIYPAEIEAAGSIRVIKQTPAGNGWIVGGAFDRVNGSNRRAAFRLLSNGTVDTSWNPNLQGNSPTVTGVDFFDSTTDILLAGQFEMPDGLYNCIRANGSTGTWDPNFTPQPDNLVHCLIRHGSGWILGGNFNTVDGVVRPNIARIQGNLGQLDGLFNPLPNGPVHSLHQIDGEIYVGGEFTTFGEGNDTKTVPHLARLLGNTPDTAWQPRPNQAVFSMTDYNGHLFIGGRFTRMARAPRANLAQLPLGGAGTPTSWNPNPNNAVNTLLIHNGALYTGGAFEIISSAVWRKIARYPLATLALDTSFQSTGEDGEVTCIAPDGAGGLFVGGSFTGWDDVFTKRGLVRITLPLGIPSSPAMERAADPPEETSDIFLSHFGAGTNWLSPAESLLPSEGKGIAWTESNNGSRTVARVQWSTDLVSWHESGDDAEGVARTIIISADGDHRTARIHPEPERVYFRLAVVAGETPAPLPQ